VNGEIQLKRNHDHYYQVQMQMDVMRMDLCDYLVWTRKGMLIVTVPYDEDFWAPKRLELICRHNAFLVPEYFLMRSPRNLSIVELEA